MLVGAPCAVCRWQLVLCAKSAPPPPPHPLIWCGESAIEKNALLSQEPCGR